MEQTDDEAYPERNGAHCGVSDVQDEEEKPICKTRGIVYTNELSEEMNSKHDGLLERENDCQ